MSTSSTHRSARRHRRHRFALATSWPPSLVNRTRKGKSCLRKISVRPIFEELEELTLLSASILGRVLNSQSGNGLAGETVFLDLNQNQKLDGTVATVVSPSTAVLPAPGQLGSFGGYASTLQVANFPSKILDLKVNLDLTNSGSSAVTVGVVSPVGLTVPNFPTLFSIQPGEHFSGTFDGESTEVDPIV